VLKKYLKKYLDGYVAAGFSLRHRFF
jgi:hypothetical protein